MWRYCICWETLDKVRSWEVVTEEEKEKFIQKLKDQHNIKDINIMIFSEEWN